jgi:hypothetical protein
MRDEPNLRARPYENRSSNDARGSLLGRFFPRDRLPDMDATLKINALRIAIGCGIWLITGPLFFGMPAGPALFLPVTACFASVVFYLLSRIGIPFAGLLDMAFRCVLIVADPVVRLVLPRLEPWFGGRISVGWINFAPLILIANDHSVVSPPSRGDLLKSAGGAGRDKAIDLMDRLKKR